jgi:putative transposase
MQSSICCEQAASGGFCHGNFPCGARSIIDFRSWKNAGVWTCRQKAIYERVQTQAGQNLCPSVVIMDSQLVKTTECGGIRGFDVNKRVKGRKRYILVDTLGMPIACRVEPANMSALRGAERLLGALGPVFPSIRIIMADAGH